MIEIEPQDQFNRQLIENTHPPDWKNPEPQDRYHLVVIGAGTAGLVTAAAAAGLGARVALIEGRLMGGDCLNVGCVPSKSVIVSSRSAAASSPSGRAAESADAQFEAAMERMRRIRAGISRHDSAERFSRLGVDVFFGFARFQSPDRVAIGGQELRFGKAVIATGSRPSTPPIEGLKETGYLTNETVFNLTRRPRRLLVVGGGPIGCELAQAFHRLGSEVTIAEMAPQFLVREDPDAAALLAEVFRREGITVHLGSRVVRVGRNGETRRVELERDGQKQTLEVDQILVAAGRTPNLDLNLEAAGVQYDSRTGVQVNDRLQTTNSRIYAAGDVCLRWQFTHVADASARIVVQNALFLGRKKVSDLIIPWCTYTDPEIAHVGMYEREALEKGIEVSTFQIDMKDVDRAVIEGEDEGFVKIHVKKGSDRILGATVVSPRAGDLISEISTAMVNGIGLGRIAGVIHPYPTQAEAIRKAGDAYNRTRLTPFVKKLLRWWLG